MAFDWGAGAVTNTYADVYSDQAGGTSSTQNLLGGSGAAAPPSASSTTTGAVTASPSNKALAWYQNPMIIGLAVLVGVALLYKVFHEWGRDESDFKDVKIGLHNWGAVLILVLAGVPGAKALLQLTLQWVTWAPWQAVVAYCLNA